MEVQQLPFNKVSERISCIKKISFLHLQICSINFLNSMLVFCGRTGILNILTLLVKEMMNIGKNLSRSAVTLIF